MRITTLIFLLVVLVLAGCSAEPEVVPVTRIVTQISQVKIITEVEVTRLIEGTRKIEVTRLVESLVTASHTPTFTPSPAPANMATATDPILLAEALETPTPECRLSQPFEWVEYSIKRGDTLSYLAVFTGITVDRIQQVNCLTDTVLSIDQALWLPKTIEPSPTSSPTALPDAPTPGGAVGGGNGGGNGDSEPPPPPPPPPKATATPP